MKIIFLKDNSSKNGPVCLSGHKLAVGGVLLLFVLPIVLGLLTYWVTASIDRAINPFVDPEYRVAVEDRVNSQKTEIKKTREYVQQHINVLGRRIGSLQAQVSRINALEMRLAENANIDLDSFKFDQDPPVGGTSTGDEKETKQIDIENAITDIQRQLDLRESEISAVDFILSRKDLKSKQTPAGWPVKGGWVSSSFGSRMHPMTGRKQFHKGVDIPGKAGSHVLAVADGVVTRSTNSGNYGWLVEIDHGDEYKTLYSHNRTNLVKVGETVVKGQEIAELGSTGRSTGPHVHFEVSRNGRAINPIKYLYKKG